MNADGTEQENVTESPDSEDQQPSWGPPAKKLTVSLEYMTALQARLCRRVMQCYPNRTQPPGR